MGVSQFYLLGDRRYRPICNQTVKFSAENSVFKNFAKSSLPVSDRTKSERPFAHRSGSVSNVVFSLLFSLIKILKIEINSHPGGVEEIEDNKEKKISRFSHKFFPQIRFYGLWSSQRSPANVGVKNIKLTCQK